LLLGLWSLLSGYMHSVVYASANPDKSADYSGVAHACATQRFGVGNTLLQPQEHFVFGRVGVDRYLRAFETRDSLCTSSLSI